MRIILLALVCAANLFGQGNSRAVLLNSVSAAGGGSPIAYVTGCNSAAGGHTPTCTFTSTAGTTIMVALGWQDSTSTPAVSDNVNGSYSSVMLVRNTSNSLQIFCFHAGAGGSITFTVGSMGNNGGIAVGEYSNISSCTADKTISAVAASGTAVDTTSAAATTVAGDLVFGAVYEPLNSTTTVAGTDGQGHSLNLRQNNSAMLGIADVTETATAAYKATFTNSNSGPWTAGMAAMKP